MHLMVCCNNIMMLKGNKKEILIHFLIMCIPVIAWLLIWNRLPNHIQLPLNLGDGVELFTNKILVIIVLNIPLLIFYGFVVLVTSADDKDVRENGDNFFIANLIVPVISIFMNGITMNYAMNKEETMFYINVFISFAFIIAGYYISKKTPDSKGGFKFKWALASKENWKKTHEFGSKVWIVLGLLCLINSFCRLLSIEYEIPLLGLISNIFPAIYSYVYHRKYE